jgi:hypothetical protein
MIKQGHKFIERNIVHLPIKVDYDIDKKAIIIKS